MSGFDTAWLAQNAHRVTGTVGGGSHAEHRTGTRTEHAETESAAQARVIAWADAQGDDRLAWLFHVPNGGHRSAKTGAQMQREGVRPGVPDLLLLIPCGGYHGLAIELKRRKGGRLRASQRAWLASLGQHGYRAEVARGADHAIAILTDYLSL